LRPETSRHTHGLTKLTQENKHLRATGRELSLDLRTQFACIDTIQEFLSERKIASLFNGDLALDLHEAECIRRDQQGAIQNLVRRIPVALQLVIDREVLHGPGVLRIKSNCFFQAGIGFRPFALTALNRAERKVNLGLVRQSTLCDLEFTGCGIEVVVDVIIN